MNSNSRFVTFGANPPDRRRLLQIEMVSRSIVGVDDEASARLKNSRHRLKLEQPLNR